MESIRFYQELLLEKNSKRPEHTNSKQVIYSDKRTNFNEYQIRTYLKLKNPKLLISKIASSGHMQLTPTKAYLETTMKTELVSSLTSTKMASNPHSSQFMMDMVEQVAATSSETTFINTSSITKVSPLIQKRQLQKEFTK